MYPSPASDRIHFNLDNEVRDQVALRVFDLEGKVWYERPSRKDSQVLQGEIPLGELPAGMFILEVRAKGWKVSRAFNKQ